jgi:peptidoglycan hydrolase-like protein with peptidoglycan-binding domain
VTALNVRVATRLGAAILAIGGLLATPIAYGAPAAGDPPAPKPGACLSLEVISLTAGKLNPDGTGTIVAKLLNPNPADKCDDGMQAEITFNGTANAIDSIDGGPDIVCAEDDFGPFAYKERCLAATFPGGASATLTFTIKGVVKGDRIAIGVTTVGDDKRAIRPGKLAYTDLSVTVPAGTGNAPGSPATGNAPATGASPVPANAPAPKPAPSSSSQLDTGQMVQMGASGDNVVAIQYLLRHHGSDIEVDGDFGEQTDGAVRAFQTSKGLTVDGVVGPETWGALWVTLRKGTTGSDAVLALQTLLNLRGQDIAIDGDFGDQTDGAVRAFQKAKGLTVDGVASPQTWAALASGN